MNPNFVFAPVLRNDHLDPNTKQKMKVNLAAQVLSHSVAAGMFAKILQGMYIFIFMVFYGLTEVLAPSKAHVVCTLKGRAKTLSNGQDAPCHYLITLLTCI